MEMYVFAFVRALNMNEQISDGYVLAMKAFLENFRLFVRPVAEETNKNRKWHIDLNEIFLPICFHFYSTLFSVGMDVMH